MSIFQAKSPRYSIKTQVLWIQKVITVKKRCMISTWSWNRRILISRTCNNESQNLLPYKSSHYNIVNKLLTNHTTSVWMIIGRLINSSHTKKLKTHFKHPARFILQKIFWIGANSHSVSNCKLTGGSRHALGN